MVGIWLIVIGVMEVVAAFGIRTTVKKVEPKATEVTEVATSDAKEATS